MKIVPLEPGRCRPVPDAGFGALRTDRGNLPLESVDVTAAVSGLVAGVEVAQEFRNPFDVTLEATYVFPLPDRAAVTAFRMEADDRVIDGVLKERGQARADYDRALREGRRAAIAEEERPDVFTIRVGNILPGERVTVRMSLSQPLPYEDGAATFRFPLVVAPRYIPGAPLDGAPAGDGTAPDTGAVPDASRITPPVLLPGFPAPVRLSLAVTLDPAGLDLREVSSSLHVVEEDGHTVRLRPGERLDRDFVLRLAFDASTSLRIDTSETNGEGDGGGTFALTVVPPALEAPRAPRDLVLLLDRSGSMGGWKMVAARRAAARIVDTLTSADRFAVLTFDSVVEQPFEGLVEASDRNRYRAVEHLARVDARGGTELLEPLREAVRLLPPAEGRERVLVLVTDGQVGNEDQILEQAGGALSAMRVHAVGIDRAVNAGFLGRLAGLGAGRCELVESEDRLDAAMEQIHRRIGAPLVTDLALKGLDTEPGTVTHLGSIFPGVPLRAYGRLRRVEPGDVEPGDVEPGDVEPGDATVTVRGLAAGEPWERQVTATAVDNPALRAVWARAHLRALEDRYAMGEHGLEAEIVRVSLEYGVLCRFTAYVAVDSRAVTEGGPEHRVIQPVEPPSGWEMPSPPSMPGFVAQAAVMAAPGRFRASSPSFEAALEQGAPMSPPAAPSPSGAPVAGAAPSAPGSAPDDAGGFGASSGGSVGPRGPVFGRPGAVPRPPRRAPRGLEPVRGQLVAELDRLRALPVADALYLADLGSRLAALSAYLGDHAELSALARELEAAERPGTDLAELRRHAVEVLTSLTGGPAPETGGGGSPAEPRRGPFWKRG
ncbi:VIT domain-containing protein [Nonomuraea roseoviolacea]|uniref:Ca-activated chloride channel family protein n=1 Tax=Nonomuraea roseoviolacea subsp. carminata TaxID=160689 RepID=A0ABT1JSK6_9ACTN|nr:VIT domain-containing protein [Nonomuraea roseoviolacea]MCP2344412.1 Ca-activated chloride channel family protein [Nonomuraea roseoviolacea subsp. carminata]